MSDLAVIDHAPPSDDGLAGLAEKANREHEQVAAAVTSAVRHAILCGEYLLEARHIVGPGNWERWYRANLEIHQTVINRYMRIAKYQHLLPPELVEGTIQVGTNARTTAGIGAAVQYLRGLPAATGSGPRTVDYAEARRLRGEGATHKQIAELLGCSVKSVQRALITDTERLKRDRRNRSAYRERKRILQREASKKRLREVSDELGEAYANLRVIQQRLQRALDTSYSKNQRRHVASAMARLADAEDFLVRASKDAP